MTEPFDQALWGRSEIVQSGGGKFKWFAVRTRDVIVLDEAGQATLQPCLARTVGLRFVGSKTSTHITAVV
ncbi:hypothetical protein PHMEG_00012860, partial [Phytophthora megakarya]